MIVALGTQLCNTILEMIQGPNVTNTLVVARSSFFATAKRVIAGCSYSASKLDLGVGQHELSPGAATREACASRGPSAIDAQCMLKTVILDIFIGVVEAISSSTAAHGGISSQAVLQWTRPITSARSARLGGQPWRRALM